MSLTSKIINRFKAAFIAQAVGIAAGAALTILLARLLKSDEYGLFFLTISVLGFTKLFSTLGIAKSAGRYITEYKEKRPRQLPNILGISIILNIFTITIVVGIVGIFHNSIAQLIGEQELSELLFIGIGLIVFHSLLEYNRVIFQSFEKIQFESSLRIIERIIRLILTIGFVVVGFGVAGALIGYTISYAISVIIGSLYIYLKMFRGHDREPVETGLAKKIIKYSGPLAVTHSAHSLEHRVDTILVGYFIGPVGVAYYTIGNQVVQFIETPMAALGFTLSPTFSSQKASGNPETAARIYEIAITQGLLLYIPAAAGLVVVSEPLINLIFGSSYSGAVPVLQVFAAFVVLQSITKITSHGLDYLGRARVRAIVKGVTAILNVVLNLLLIPMMGVVGAAIATVSTFAIYTFASVYIIHSELNLRLGWMTKHISQTIIVTLFMLVVLFPISNLIEGFISLFATIVLGVVIWFAPSFALGLIDIERIKQI